MCREVRGVVTARLGSATEGTGAGVVPAAPPTIAGGSGRPPDLDPASPSSDPNPDPKPDPAFGCRPSPPCAVPALPGAPRLAAAPPAGAMRYRAGPEAAGGGAALPAPPAPCACMPRAVRIRPSPARMLLGSTGQTRPALPLAACRSVATRTWPPAPPAGKPSPCVPKLALVAPGCGAGAASGMPLAATAPPGPGPPIPVAAAGGVRAAAAGAAALARAAPAPPEPPAALGGVGVSLPGRGPAGAAAAAAPNPMAAADKVPRVRARRGTNTSHGARGDGLRCRGACRPAT